MQGLLKISFFFFMAFIVVSTVQKQGLAGQYTNIRTSRTIHLAGHVFYFVTQTCIQNSGIDMHY
jgi:hypothetical protein